MPASSRQSRTTTPPALYRWLMETISYQGIANRIASDYLDRHGRVQWADLKNGLIPSLADYDR